VYFPELVVECLKDATGQDFGKEKEKWITWIKANIAKPAQTAPLKRP
jgi:hypothetical protein